MKFLTGVIFGFLLAMVLVQSETLEKKFAIATGLLVGIIAMLSLSIFGVNTTAPFKTIEEEKKNDNWWKNGEKPPWEN